MAVRSGLARSVKRHAAPSQNELTPYCTTGAITRSPSSKPGRIIASPPTVCEPPKDYAQTLGLLFTDAQSGKHILEFDLTTGLEEASRHVPQPARPAANRVIHQLWE